ncbi:AAA family ATPase [Nakamurella endophytica]|uniref:ATP-dependent RecD-like DNA helicase n=1 Tax=Nakamurella endophytica TaxID=1748367 RepID=A0A917WCM4_9ACTN|nr:AAA family ATPase [Nakamurella endophytica]GGL93219.1 ATP-dependent RecD-like DNA helicase [Nakamurella endophytica]
MPRLTSGSDLRADAPDTAVSAPAPGSAAAVFTEFCAAGLWPGVGATLQRALAGAGLRTPGQVSVAALAALPSVTPRRAERLYTAWIGASHLYELAEVLVPQELPVRWSARLVDLLGDDALATLRADPWRLLELPDAAVAQADRLARAFDPATDRSDSRRGRALVDWTLARFARQGHTVTPVPMVREALAPFGVDADAAVRDAVAAGSVQQVGDPAAPALCRTALAAAEDAIAEHLARLVSTGRSLAGDRAVTAAARDLDDTQALAVGLASRQGVSVLTGGPGTGKSRTVAAVVALCTRVDAAVALAAPTGRAAKRLEELTGHPATTVHKLLGAWRRPGTPGSAGAGSGTAGFDHDAAHPIEADLVVVDEASMLDVELGAALLAAVPDAAHLVVVGDPAQLPSIGPGRLLGDLLDSGTLPVTELSTLYRQSEGGAIARLATAVRGGALVAPPAGDHEVVVVPCRGSDEAAHRVVQLVTDSIPRVFGASGDAVQVVTPVHRGRAGTQALNRALKELLNPGRGVVRGFDAGDRVVATANHPEAEPAGFANGEVGTVLSTGDNSLRVTFPGGDADVSGKALGDLLHGWAITVHRAQGSEWEAVVVVLPPEAGAMLSRPLVYTALTRAKRHLSVVHAAGPALARSVRDVGAEPRRTRLAPLLAERLGPADR